MTVAGAEFWIDVGGTFTDCIGRTPDGRLIQHKLLSDGSYKGRAASGSSREALIDPRQRAAPDGFFEGWTLHVDLPGDPIAARVARESSGACVAAESRVARVARFDAATGRLSLDPPLPTQPPAGAPYELRCGRPAPLVGIARLLGQRPDEPLGRVTVKLGTTRGTNALLERRGARTAFLTTAGFGDVLRIAFQDRPKLFDLNIRKPVDLYECSVEIDERIDARGSVLKAADAIAVRRVLAELRDRGVESLAVCLMNAYRNGAHERLVGQAAREMGFRHVALSCEVSPLQRIVPRGDTTVVEAYVTPVIRDYVESIRAGMPDGRLMLMTSTGGLADAASVSAKDTVLSGPAGGVVGCAAVARAAGFDRAIGFDMGGTSTDVCRYSGEFERRYEMRLTDDATRTAVRIVAPMLAIETIAAGGGSICDFDGVKPTVGPRSAGADPGPACYGRGGPLCITDVNLLLGRIPPGRFAFPLDIAAARRRADELIERIEAATGARYRRETLAAGLAAIANECMAAAIRRISTARGRDVRDHVLVSLGGAGGQHACALAELLGIRRILLHPLAGVLSAYGIGVADVRRFGAMDVGRPWSSELIAWLAPRFAELERSLRDEVRGEGVADDRIQPPARSLDLRYAGQEAVINVPRPEDEDYAGAFERMHRRMYGFAFEGRAIEVRALRVEVVGRCEDNDAVSVNPAPRSEPLSSCESAPAFFGTRFQETPVLDREDLRPGDHLDGPAIVAESTGTIVIEPGWSGEVTPRGDVLLTHDPNRARFDAQCGDGNEALPSSLRSSIPDPIHLELFNNRFAAIAEQMGESLRRTALSTNVKERLDFSCAVFDQAGELVVNAPHIPVHLGAMSECVKQLVATVGPMRPGDVYVTNHPFRGGTHLPDVTVVTPVFEGEPEVGSRKCAVGSLESEVGSSKAGLGRAESQEGRLQEGRLQEGRLQEGRLQEGRLKKARVGQASSLPGGLEARPTLSSGPTLSSPASGGGPLFYVASRAHHAEIGGAAPGSMPPFSRNLAEEGVVVDAFLLARGGRSREAEVRALLAAGPHPSRRIDENIADLHAQVAANQTGATLLSDTLASLGVEHVTQYMLHVREAAERKMRQAISRLKDGRYSFRDALDDGSPLAVAIDVAGDAARVDFTGTGLVLPGNLNANRAIVASAVLYCFRCLIDEDIPLNAGVLAPIDIVLPECFLNPPRFDEPSRCAAVAGGNVETSQRIVDAIFGALGVVAAGQGTMNNVIFGDRNFGYYETIGGGSGAGPGFDGADAVHTHMTNTRLTDPEVLEDRYPVRLRRFAIRRGSGGAGRYRGGDGMIREIEFLAPLELSLLTQRRLRQPYGLAGGAPGAVGRNTLMRAGGEQAGDDQTAGVELPPIAHAMIQPGDILRIETPGGGGYGTTCARPSNSAEPA